MSASVALGAGPSEVVRGEAPHSGPARFYVGVWSEGGAARGGARGAGDPSSGGDEAMGG